MIPCIIAYIGPEAALPLLSMLAAVFGAILIGWRWVVSAFRRIFRLFFRRGAAPSEATSAPQSKSPNR